MLPAEKIEASLLIDLLMRMFNSGQKQEAPVDSELLVLLPSVYIAAAFSFEIRLFIAKLGSVVEFLSLWPK